jgi:hypothetical protein
MEWIYLFLWYREFAAQQASSIYLLSTNVSTLTPSSLCFALPGLHFPCLDEVHAAI